MSNSPITFIVDVFNMLMMLILGLLVLKLRDGLKYRILSVIAVIVLCASSVFSEFLMSLSTMIGLNLKQEL